jgi:hypothetical protein
MENNNDLDKFLKHKMSLHELEISIPPLSVEVKKRIAAKKKSTIEPGCFYEKFSSFFNIQTKLYRVGIAVLIIAGFIFYFLNEQTAESSLITQNTASKDASVTITSSTVLAGLTTLANKSSVNSSTVLTSILTFVVRD